MQLLYKLKNRFFLTIVSLLVSSCSVISQELSCKFAEIDCYRFNYSSVDSFNDSVLKYSEQWSLSDPTNALIKITPKEKLSISSSVEAENLILESPESIYALGIYIKNNQMPREWLFVAEQAYLRSWNSLGR